MKTWFDEFRRFAGIRLAALALSMVAAHASSAPTTWPFLTVMPGAGWVGEMIHANGRFYAARGEANSEGQILFSTDGAAWTVAATTPGKRLLGLAHGNGVYVAVGEGGVILRSVDGVTWAEIPSGTSAELYDVEYGAGKFVAAGLFGAVLWSPDGASWTPASGTGSAYDVAYFKGAFYQAGSYGNFGRSADGVTWSPIALVGDENIGVLVAGPDDLVLGTYHGEIYQSKDGVVWNRRESPVTEGLFGGVFANGTFVLGGTGGQIVHSTNAAAWQRAATAASESLNLQAVAYGNGAFLASGAWGYVFQSREGENFDFSMQAAALEFPETPFGAKSVLPVRIANTGTLPIDRVELRPEGRHAAAFVSSGVQQKIPAGSNAIVLVEFRPALIGPMEASLRLVAHGAVRSARVAAARGAGSAPAWAQTVALRGRATELATGLPLAGVQVRSPAGLATSDEAGHFSLPAPAGLQSIVEFSKPGYLTRSATVLPDRAGSLIDNISLVNLDHPGFDLGGYKRIMFDRQRVAPYQSTRWLGAPLVYIDTRPDPFSGESFSDAHVLSISNWVPSFLQRMTGGYLRDLHVRHGTNPPARDAMIFQLDSRMATLGAAGGGSEPDGEIVRQVVYLKTPNIASVLSVLLHETGHALGLGHANGDFPALMAGASIYWPNRAVNSAASETAFDLLMGQILYLRPPGSQTDPDESRAIEHDSLGFPLRTGAEIAAPLQIGILKPEEEISLLVQGRALRPYRIQKSSDLQAWQTVLWLDQSSAVQLWSAPNDSAGSPQAFYRVIEGY